MNFTKMHGLGNDFIILNCLDKTVNNRNILAKKLCDRKLGIGADGLMLVLPSDNADIKMQIINSDGTEPEMCGNGIRCFAKYLYVNRIINKTIFEVETLAGIMKPELIIENNIATKVKVNMGKLKLKPYEIPVNGFNSIVINKEIKIDNKEFNINCASMGNPHCVIIVKELEDYLVKNIGPKIESHELFPNKTNVEFVEVLDYKNIKMRVWERGVGETLACGTGACASALVTNLNKMTGKKVNVILERGTLFIELQEDGSITMTGPATEVFDGEVNLNLL